MKPDGPQENDDRTYPLAPVPAVGALVFREGKILLIKRAKEPSKGKWSIPGGRIELGETSYEAARREVMEECSIEVEIERVLDSVDNIVRDEDGRIQYHYVIIDLLAKHVGGDIRAGSDAAECRWVNVPEVLEMDIAPMLRAVLKRNGLA